MWEIIQKVTKISTKKSLLSQNFLKIESILVKHSNSHNFLLEIKKKYEDDWGNPFKKGYNMEKMKKYILEDLRIRYMGGENSIYY